MSQGMDVDNVLQGVEQLREHSFASASEKRRAMLALRSASDELQQPMDKLLEMWGAVSSELALTA